MSYFASRPEQSTSAEAALLTALNNLATTPSGFMIVKSSATTFANIATMSSTSINGILKGNGATISAAVAGTDYTSPSSTEVMTNKTLSAPKFADAGFIADANGNAIVTFSTTASAVDNLQIKNDVTGLGPLVKLSAVGSDSNVGIALSPKGTGLIRITDGTDTTKVTVFDLSGVTAAKKTTLTFANSVDRIVTFPDAAGTITILGNASVGSGSVVLATSPTLTTPSLGVATATSINSLTITTSTGTFTLVNGKTFTVNKSLTLDGTDSTTMTFPTTNATIARTDAAQTFSGTQTFSNAIIYTNNAITASGNAATVPVTAKLNTVTNNSAATLTITMTTTSAVDGQMTIVRILDSSAAAQTITWVNTENSTVTAPTTSNGSTTLFLTVGFIYNSATTKWRCIASA